MNKLLGYVLCLIGLVGLAISGNFLTFLPIKIPAGIAKSTILIASGAVIIVGLLFVIKSGPKKLKEVPIYQGNAVVGYRRQR
jgi:hypothetical protein